MYKILAMISVKPIIGRRDIPMITRNQLKSANESVRMMWALWGILNIETILIQDKNFNFYVIFSEKHFIR
jgi:hypothetical protein